MSPNSEFAIQVSKASAQPFTSWPASASVDGEQFTLLAINTGLSGTGSWTEQTTTNQWTELLFQIGTNRPAQRTIDAHDRGPWIIQSVELRDPFGNIVRPGGVHGRILPMGSQYMNRRDDGIALIPGAIWPDETWNVRAEFVRVATPSLDAAHRWTTSVHLPEPGQKISLNQTGRIEGCEVRLHWIETTNNVRPGLNSPARVAFPLDSPTTISLTFARKEHTWVWETLSAEDQRGSNVLRGSAFFSSNGQYLPLRPFRESTDVKLTFGLTHQVTVELSGKPSILRENVARWAPKQ